MAPRLRPAAALVLLVLLGAASPGCSLQLRAGRPPRPFLSSRRGSARAGGLAGGLTCAARGEEPAAAAGAAGSALAPPGNQTVTREFVSLAVPAFFAIAAEPIASFTDTAFLGRLGAADLAAAGVAINALYTAAKLFLDPLQKTSVSLVAGKSDEELRASALTALLLALAVGLSQTLFFVPFAAQTIGTFGLAGGTEVSEKAIAYLRVRAAGAPAGALLVVANGIFRGLGDTRTPLKWTVLGVALNVALDALLIFGFAFQVGGLTLRLDGMGAAGAAVATVVGLHVSVAGLLVELRRRLGPVPRRSDILPRVRSTLRLYLSSGGLVLLRSLGKILTYAVIGRFAAKLGPTSAAAYALVFQLGVCITQLSESLAVAVQTLTAKYLPSDPQRARRAVAIAVKGGLLLCSATVLLTWFNRVGIIHALNTDEGVRQAALRIMPAVLSAQVLKGLAYPTNAVLLGGRDWAWSTASMWASSLATLGCIAAMLCAPGGVAAAGATALGLGQLWWALTLFFGVQVSVSVLRWSSGRGPWEPWRRHRGGALAAAKADD